MTRLMTDGAESGDISRINAISGAITVVTNPVRTGTYAYNCAHNITSNGIFDTAAFAATSEWYIRFGVRFTAENLRFLMFSNGGTEAGSLRMIAYGNGISQCSVYDGTTLRATSSFFTMNLNEWHVFEVYFKHAANPNGIITVKFDGSQVINFSGATNSQSQIDRFRFISEGLLGVNIIFDDIAVNDTNGIIDNSWIGDGGVLPALVPTATGTYGQMLVSGSATGWQATDEIPANSTDFIYSSVTGSRSTFNMSDLSGLPAGASVSRLWVELYAKETAATGDKIATLLRSGGVDRQGSDQALTTAYVRYLSAEYLTDPQNTGTWTAGNINALEAGGVAQ